MMQNYSKNPKPARNETKFNNTKKWCNHLDYTTFLIDAYFLFIVVFGELLNLLKVSILDVIILRSVLLGLILLIVERSLLLVSTRLRTSLCTLIHLL